jgi:hypothetical protein
VLIINKLHVTVKCIIESATGLWCVDDIKGVLWSTEKGKGWTHQWLQVKKKYAFDQWLQNPMTKMGYSEARSTAMMKGTIYSLQENGAVRRRRGRRREKDCQQQGSWQIDQRPKWKWN